MEVINMKKTLTIESAEINCNTSTFSSVRIIINSVRSKETTNRCNERMKNLQRNSNLVDCSEEEILSKVKQLLKEEFPNIPTELKIESLNEEKNIEIPFMVQISECDEENGICLGVYEGGYQRIKGNVTEITVYLKKGKIK